MQNNWAPDLGLKKSQQPAHLVQRYDQEQQFMLDHQNDTDQALLQ